MSSLRALRFSPLGRPSTFPSFSTNLKLQRLNPLSLATYSPRTTLQPRISSIIQPRRFYSTPPSLPPSSSSDSSPAPPSTHSPALATKHENIYTIPNALTLARILSCPLIGYYIVKGELGIATSLLFVAGVSDLVDGYLARKYNMGTVLGSIMDPAADKLLMTTMVVSLTMRGMLPSKSRLWLSLALLLVYDVLNGARRM